jgi:MFS family permease
VRERLGIPPIGGNVRFVTAIAIDALGSGIYFPLAILYFVATTQLTPVQVGAAFTLAGLVAIPFCLLLGPMVDRVGPKRILLAANVLHLISFLSFPFVDTLITVTAVLILESFASDGVLVCLSTSCGHH